MKNFYLVQIDQHFLFTIFIVVSLLYQFAVLKNESLVDVGLSPTPLWIESEYM